MNPNIFHWTFVGAYLAMFTLRVYYARKARRSRSDVQIKEGKLNLALRALFGLGYIGALWFYVLIPRWFDVAVLNFPGWLRWAGALISVGSVLLLWWVQWALDVQFDTNLHVQADHQLITHGPYRWVRHPMYTTLFLMGLGWFMLTANWLIGLPLTLGIIFVVISRVKKEEAVLLDLFGERYRAYMQTTGRFLPKMIHSTISVVL